MKYAERDITRFIDRIKSLFGRAADPREPQLKAVGAHAVDVIVRRTRLGFGVDKVEGLRRRLNPLSDRYKAFRKAHAGALNQFTTAGRSNLTATGQMLDSMGATIRRRLGKTKIVIAPSGGRTPSVFDDGSLSNIEVAELVAKGGRIFNNLSRPEVAQLRNYYRRTFGDLVKRKLR